MSAVTRREVKTFAPGSGAAGSLALLDAQPEHLLVVVSADGRVLDDVEVLTCLAVVKNLPLGKEPRVIRRARESVCASKSFVASARYQAKADGRVLLSHSCRRP